MSLSRPTLRHALHHLPYYLRLGVLHLAVVVCYALLVSSRFFAVLSNSSKIGKFTYKLISPIRHNLLVFLRRARIENEGILK